MNDDRFGNNANNNSNNDGSPIDARRHQPGRGSCYGCPVRKKSKALMIISLLLAVLCLIVVVFISVFFRNFRISRLMSHEDSFTQVQAAELAHGEPMNLITDYSVYCGDIDGIKVDLVSADVDIMPAEDDNIKVEWYSSRDKDDFDAIVTADGGKLVIKEKQKGVFNFGWDDSSVVYIYVPAGDYDKFDIDTTSGSISMLADDALDVDKVDVSTVSGFMEICGIDGADELEASTTSGAINLSDVSSDKIDVSTVSGTSALSGVTCNKFKGSSTSGDISFNEFHALESEVKTVSGDTVYSGGACPSVVLRSTSGSLDFYSFAFDSLSMNTTSGDVYIGDIPGGDYIKLKSNTISGDVYDYSERIRDDGRIKINFSATSGDITIE